MGYSSNNRHESRYSAEEESRYAAGHGQNGEAHEEFIGQPPRRRRESYSDFDPRGEGGTTNRNRKYLQTNPHPTTRQINRNFKETPYREQGRIFPDSDESTYFDSEYREESGRIGDSGRYTSRSWSVSGPYSGLGPKGYEVSDERLHERVCDRLQECGQVDASDIEVSCSNGIVTLKGSVEDRKTKRIAEDCLEDIQGIDDIMNNLSVKKGLLKKAKEWFVSDDDSSDKDSYQ